MKTTITRRSKAFQFGDPPFYKGLTVGQIIREDWDKLYVRVDDEWYPVRGNPKLQKLVSGECDKLTIHYRTEAKFWNDFVQARTKCTTLCKLKRLWNKVEPRTKGLEALTQMFFGTVGVFEDAYKWMKPMALSFVLYALAILVIVYTAGFVSLALVIDAKGKEIQLKHFQDYLETRDYIDQEIDKSHQFDPSEPPQPGTWDITHLWVKGLVDIRIGPNGQAYEFAPGAGPEEWPLLERPEWYGGPAPPPKELPNEDPMGVEDE